MILTCPKCGFRFENINEKDELIMVCPSCKIKWNIKKKEKKNFLCYVADHKSFFRDFIINNLEEMEIDTKVFEDGFFLKKCISEELPNLLITNVFLPRVLGVEIVEELKSNSSKRNIPVILIGAIHKIERYHRKPKFLYGADEYIEEGISSEIFKSIVKRLLGISYEKQFVRSPEEEHKLRKMRILVNEIVTENEEIIKRYLDGGDRESIKELFLKASIMLRSKYPELSEDLMKAFLIQYLRKKIEERKNG